MQQEHVRQMLRRTIVRPTVTVVNRVNQPRGLQRSTPQAIPCAPIIKQTTPQPLVRHFPDGRLTRKGVGQSVVNRMTVHREHIPSAVRKTHPQVSHISTGLTHEQTQKVQSLQGVGVGKYFIILGNGPSLKQIDTSKLSQYAALQLCTINVPDIRCWPTPYWAFYDRSQFNRHKEQFKTFTGTIFNSVGIKEPNSHSIKFRNIGGLGYSKDASVGIHVGMSSVFATIQIAMYMNFNRIYIVGCDMNENVESEQTHFYGVNPDVAPAERVKRFKKEANWYDRMVTALDDRERQKIVFCSKGVNKWPFTNAFTQVQANETTEYIIEDSGNAC